MKLILLPFTLVIVLLTGLLLVTAATISSLLSSLASFCAYIIVQLLVWQESEMLVKLTMILGTQNNTEETK